MASFRNIPWRRKLDAAMGDCMGCGRGTCPDSCREAVDSELDAIVDAIRAQGEERGRDRWRIRKHDYAGRFGSEAYRTAIEELARVPWDVVGVPCYDVAQIEAGAVELVAQMFGQGYNTVVEYVWQWGHDGMHDPKDMSPSAR